MTLKSSIGWATKTWNPVTGCWGPYGTKDAPDRCFYCYAHRMSKRLKGRYGYPVYNPFMPWFHEDRIRGPYGWKKPHKIFVCSMGDLFGDWVDPLWISRVIDVAHDNPQHTFIFLTKNPIRYIEYDFPPNCWLGTTADNYDSSCNNGVKLSTHFDNITFLSYEPLLSNVHVVELDLWRINWVIIGAMTGPGADRHIPRLLWIKNILIYAQHFNIPVFMKDNLKPYWPYDLIREWPIIQV